LLSEINTRGLIRLTHDPVITFSGGHVNPAMTLAMAVAGRLQWIKVPVYWLAQYIGAFVGAACVYLVYYGLLPPNLNDVVSRREYL